MEKVYHSSMQRGLFELAPKISTHGKPLVYATKDMVISAIFAVNKKKCFGDFSIAKARNPQTQIPYICERYKSAFDNAYSNVAGSIYILDGKKFQEGFTSWGEEVVSFESVKVEEEIQIDDMKNYLLNLEQQGRLKIYKYPSRPEWIPKSDSDLIEKAHKWSKEDKNSSVWKLFEKLHPNLAAEG